MMYGFNRRSGRLVPITELVDTFPTPPQSKTEASFILPIYERRPPAEGYGNPCGWVL
jgi:hypothetical protein